MVPSKLLLPIGLLAMLASTPALAQGPRPAPSLPAHGLASSPIADLEEAAGHVIALGPRLLVETPRGRFELVTFPQEAPRTVEQILRLVRAGFYTGLAVHRVVPGFAVQAGDPATRDHAVSDPAVGRGGSGHPLPPEFEAQSLHSITGTVALARGNDPASGDSQFFITLAPQPALDGAYTIWGQVTSGLDVLPKLKPGDRLTRVTIAK